jgi:hypothetical protein
LPLRYHDNGIRGWDVPCFWTEICLRISKSTSWDKLANLNASIILDVADFCIPSVTHRGDLGRLCFAQCEKRRWNLVSVRHLLWPLSADV